MFSNDQLQHCLAEMRESGYTIVNDFIDEARLCKAQIDAETLLEPIRSKTPSLNGQPIVGRMCKGLFYKTRDFDDIYTHPVLLRIVNQYLTPLEIPRRGFWDPYIQLAGCMIKDVVPGQRNRGFHQDDVFYPISRPRAPLVVNSLLALDDFSISNGATRVVPESHQWLKPVEQDADYVDIEIKAGSAVIFDGSLWHNNGDNTTENLHRRALNMYYSCRWLRTINEPYLGLSTDALGDLPSDLRVLL